MNHQTDLSPHDLLSGGVQSAYGTWRQRREFHPFDGAWADDGPLRKLLIKNFQLPVAPGS